MPSYPDETSILGSLDSQAAPEQAPPAAPEPTAPAAPAEEKFWDVPWNGKSIRGTESDLLKWASQGYDYSQKMNELSSKQSEWDRQRQESEARIKPFQEIDSYAQQNPDWWAHVEKNWESREQVKQESLLQQLPPEIKPVFENLLSEQKQIKEFQAQWHQEKMEQAAKEDDQKLLSTVQELQAKHKIDFASRDESGQTLEYRVLAFARENGINHPDPQKAFEIAFNAYYQPVWAKHYEMQGREAERKERDKARESGLLSRTPAPASPSQDAAPRGRPRTYEEGYRASLSEHGLS